MRGKRRASSRVLGITVVVALVAGMVPAAGLGAVRSSKGVGLSRYEAAAESVSAGVRSPLQVRDATRTIVRWAPGVQAEQIGAAASRIGFRVVRNSSRLGCSLVEPTRKGLTAPDLAVELKRARLAVKADVEKVYSYAQVEPPNDPYFPSQWALENTGQTGGTPDADIDAPEAWAGKGSGSSDVIVAVVDTGIDITHEDLKDNIWRNVGEIPGNGRDDDRNGYIDDVNGFDFSMYDNTVYDQSDGDQHGTHVAGIIGAAGDNGKGVAGINHDVTIMPVKFLGPWGGGEFEGAEAIVYAVDNGAQVINCSWGGSYSQLIEEALQYAAAHGVVVCAAAGNDSMDIDENRDYFFPASSDATSVITVASTDHNDEISYFSNFGDETVELAAPGEEVTSTLPYDVAGVYVNDMPYKVAFLAFAAEGIEPVSAGKAAVTSSLSKLGATTSTPIVVVDDSMPSAMGETEGERLAFYTSALEGAGFTSVSTWSTERQGAPSSAALQGKVVVWFTGAIQAGWYEATTLDVTDRAALTSDLDNGGRLLLVSGEVANDVAWFDSEFMERYLHVLPSDMATWGSTLRGTPDTSFSGVSGTLSSAYTIVDEGWWPTGSDPLYLLDDVPQSIFEMGGYGPLSGTSMAAPMVSGAAAHILAAAPGIGADEIKARIENTTDSLDSLAGLVNGSGRLNLARAFEVYPGRPTITSPRSGDVIRAGQQALLAWTPSAGGSSDATFEAQIGLPVVSWAEDFEDANLEGWEMDGTVSWETTTSAHSGGFAMWSGRMSPGDSGSIETTVNVPSGGGTLSVWMMSEGVEGGMWGSVYCDGVWLADVYGPTEWTKYEAPVPEGEHTLAVLAYFDTIVDESETGYVVVDDINLSAHEYQPLATTSAGDFDVDFSVPDIETPDLWLRVRSNLDGVSSGWAYVKNVKVSADSQAPAAPAEFTAIPGEDGDVQLAWTDPADADFSYTRILRSVAATPSGPLDPEAVVVYEGAGGAFHDVGLASGTTARYAAFAVDDDANWSEGAYAEAAIVDTTGPEPVRFLEAGMREGAVAVSWMNPPAWQISGVKVLRRTDGFPASFDDPQASVVFDGPGACVFDYDVMDEPDGTTAYYSVYAYDASMNISPASKVSIVLDVTPPEGCTHFVDLDSYPNNETGQVVFFTESAAVTLGVDVIGASQMRFNQGDGWSAWEDFADTKAFTLPAIDGMNVVLAEFRDDAGNLLQTETLVYHDTTVPQAPTGLTAYNWNYGVRLVWDMPEDESVVSWNVYMAESEAGPWMLANEEFPVEWPEHVVSGLAAGTAYYFKVQAVDGVGHESPASQIASATPNEGVVRVFGENRYATALEVTSRTFASASTVVLASGAGYADALGASGLAGALEAPVLLTEPTRLSAGVAHEIERLGATRVVIVGGTSAISQTVEGQLDPALAVDRIAGRDRFDTSAKIARAIAEELGEEFAGEAFIANGYGFADALAAAPVAYAARMPILLVAPDFVPEPVAAVTEDLGIVEAYTLGGEAAVGGDVPAEMGYDEESRLAGANRYETAVAIAEYADAMGWNDFGVTGVATGAGFADALAGGAAIGSQGGVMLLTSPDWLSPEAESALFDHASEVERLELFGGPNAVSDDVMQQIIDVFMYGGSPF
ncbi:MAG: S8 family serine peptidase [Coriobacteriales bacterium]